MNHKYTKTPEEYAAFFIGENKITHPDYQYIIHLAEPRCFIKYTLEDAIFADYDDFYNHIAEVQWLDGRQHAPEGKELEAFLTKCWNYLAIEERILDDDLEEEDEDED
ncbi:MAG TPA: hypothetical protein VEB42_06220 [Chitinophagaceae bacterium]|nr:hypothetical protein [Chitinophagaceae bacterium]